MSKVLKEGLSASVLIYVVLIFNYIFATLFVRELGAGLYGHFVYLATLQTFLLTLVGFGFQVQILRFQSDLEQFRPIASVFVCLAVVITGWSCVCYTRHAGSDGGPVLYVLVCATLTTLLNATSPLWQWVERVGSFQCSRFVLALLKTGMLVGVLIWPHTETMWLISLGVGSAGIVFWSVNWLGLFSAKSLLEAKSYVACCQHFNLKLWFSQLAIVVYGRIDILMLPLLGATTTDIGIYGYLYGFFSAVVMLPSTIQSVLLRPLFAKELQGEDIFHKIYLIYITCGLVIGCGFYWILPPVLAWLVGPESSNQQVIEVLALCIPVVFLANLLGLALLVEAKDGWRSIAQWGAAGINVVLNLLWIPKFGILGAAAATTLAYLGLLTLFACGVFKYDVWKLRSYALPLSIIILTMAVSLLWLCRSFFV